MRLKFENVQFQAQLNFKKFRSKGSKPHSEEVIKTRQFLSIFSIYSPLKSTLSVQRCPYIAFPSQKMAVSKSSKNSSTILELIIVTEMLIMQVGFEF